LTKSENPEEKIKAEIPIKKSKIVDLSEVKNITNKIASNFEPKQEQPIKE
jgi:hypothetical protein